VRLLESDKEARRTYRERYQHIFADEYQDLNQGQYRIIRALAPPRSPGCDIGIIGDPDQSIYGFRGSDSEYFKRFSQDYTHAEVIRLTRNYRSTKTILDASYQVVGARRDQSAEARTYSQINGVQTISMIEASNENSEAEAIARIIENLVGGTGFHSIDTGRIGDANCTGPMPSIG
jgi:superfamily I DNA/RNA helicase